MCALPAGCAEYVELGDDCPGTTCALDAGYDLDATRGLDAAPLLDASSCSATAADASSCACEVGATHLLAHWPLDEGAGGVAHDVLGAHDGVLQPTPSQSPWVAGRVAGALSFDAIDDVAVGAITEPLQAVSLWLEARTTEQVTTPMTMQMPSSHGPLDQWTHPELAYADDNMTATAASLIGTKAQHWGGFHLAQLVPADATILGITVTVDTGNIGLLGGLSVELSWDGGTSHTQSHYAWGQLIIGSDLRQAGGPDKLWGRTWTTSDFSDANFRVRASFGGIANAMSLDYVGVEVAYTQQTVGRTILGLAPNVSLAFDGDTVQSVGWPAVTYVNGALGGTLREGWNHVAVVGAQPLSASDVRLGAATLDTLGFPFDGQLDDVLFFGEALTPAQVAGLSRAPRCAP